MRYYINKYDDLHEINKELFYSLARAKSREQMIVYAGGRRIARVVRTKRARL